MEVINLIIQKFIEVLNTIDFGLMLLVIATGEITTKKLWIKPHKIVSTFQKVFIVSFPIAIVYSIYLNIDFKVAVLTYVSSFWLHGLIAKSILDELFPKK